MTLQQEAYQLLCGLPEENVRLIIALIQKMMPEEKADAKENTFSEPVFSKRERKRNAFRKLESTRKRAAEFFGPDFDTEKEIAEAINEKYGHFD